MPGTCSSQAAREPPVLGLSLLVYKMDTGRTSRSESLTLDACNQFSEHPGPGSFTNNQMRSEGPGQPSVPLSLAFLLPGKIRNPSTLPRPAKAQLGCLERVRLVDGATEALSSPR